MTHPIIGWESADPVPHAHQFNHYLQAQNGRLYLHNLDLADIFLRNTNPFPSPLEIVYLPLIKHQIEKMNQIFAQVSAEVGYEGQFHYTYASKANAAEEVIRTTLKAGAHHEMSSTVDVDIAKIMIERGLLTPDRFVISNGFKPVGSDYAQNLLSLKGVHDNLIPVIEDLGELGTFLGSAHHFDVGLRQKSYGPQTTEAEMNAANSRVWCGHGDAVENGRLHRRRPQSQSQTVSLHGWQPTYRH